MADPIPALASTMLIFYLEDIISTRRNPKCHRRGDIIFTETTFHLKRLLTYYILGSAAYFLYMIFFIIPVLNDDLDKSSNKEFLCELYYDKSFCPINLILKLFKS